MSTLIKHKIFINYDKYKTYKEDSIGWFIYIIPTISLQKTKILRIEEALMAVYIIDEETKTLTKINEIDSNNAVIIPAFGAGRIKTNAYEFCFHPDNSHIFK